MPIPGVVIGGSPRFVNAVIAPLASKMGVWPEVAPDPRQFMSLCGGARLAVLEVQGDEWLTLAHDLRALHGGALGIVVAVPPDTAARHVDDAADELVSWDGRAEPVLEAVQRLVASRGEPAGEAPPPPTPEGPDRAAKVVAEPPAPPPPAAGEVVAPGSSDTWPGTIHSWSEAESLLVAAAAGLWPEEALRPLAERVVASLSDLEKGALRGSPLPVEPGPIRRAAALRWVVTAALEGAPEPGSPVDAAAVQTILGEIDDALGGLKDAGAGPEVQPALEALRRVLVKEAVDLTDAVHRIVPSEVPQEPVRRAPPAPRKEEQAPRRDVAFAAGAGREPRGHRGLWIALAVTILVGLALHGWNLLLARSSGPPPTAAAGRPSSRP